MIILVLFGLIPILMPIVSQYEGEFFPVVRNVEIVEVELESESPELGIVVEVMFDKVRACEFIAIRWFDRYGGTVPVLFEPDLEEIEVTPVFTRPVMDGQRAGQWKLIGLDELEGSVAIVSHRCNPLWLTYTRFYP